MFYGVRDWDDLQIDLYFSLHVDFIIQFAGIVPVFLEFNGYHPIQCSKPVLAYQYVCSLYLAYTSQVDSVFFVQSDWLLYLRISYTIHLRAKQGGVPFCFYHERRTCFLMKEIAMGDNTKEATTFGKKVFKDS